MQLVRAPKACVKLCDIPSSQDLRRARVCTAEWPTFGRARDGKTSGRGRSEIWRTLRGIYKE